ncbi:MAG TPA: hypothetical protein DCZ12_15590 [Gammaproteobacteria bacterium]|nr:hypothetical protein [Gammaproteobacteria bacterium]
MEGTEVRFQQVKDVIHYTSQLHEKLAAYYQCLSDQSDQQRMKMLLNYLSRHEKHLSDVFERYSSDVETSVRETWLQFVPSEKLVEALECGPIDTDMSVDDVIEQVIAYDDALIDLYNEVINETSAPDVKEVFQNVLAMESHIMRQTVRNALMMNEI